MLGDVYKRRDDQLVHFDGYLVNSTEKAFAVTTNPDSLKGTWLPKSLLQNVIEGNVNFSCDLPIWLAKERKLI